MNNAILIYFNITFKVAQSTKGVSFMQGYVNLNLKPWEIFGGKKAFFIRYADIIKKTITELKLKALDPAIVSSISAEHAKASVSNVALLDPSIYGGRRFAHLHYMGNIYRLDEKQWAGFIDKVKVDMVARLQKANSISLENVIEINDALDPVS